MRVIVAGSRNFTDYDRAERVIKSVIGDKKDVQIVSGGCYGADALGERYAKENGCDVKFFRADFDTYGRSAGPRRNREMAEYAAKDNGVLIAFWNGKSKGTRSMIQYADINHLTTVVEMI